MTRHASAAALALSSILLTLAACQKAPGEGQADTRITNVEVQPGTISDDMIVLDTVADQATAIDTKSMAPIYDTVAPQSADPTKAGDADTERPKPSRETPAPVPPETKPGDTVMTPGG